MSNEAVQNGKEKKWPLVVFLLGIFAFFVAWAVVQPYNAPPDEQMRFQVVEFLMKHGTLPDGRDPEILNKTWGLSYGFYPMLVYIFMAIPAKIVSFFTSSEGAIVLAARIINCIFGTLTAFFAVKISNLLLKGIYRYVFIALVCFLPQFLFLGSYINVDMMALFSTSWILYCWIRGVRENWPWKICLQIAIACSFCTLSYYNAYGYILCSFFLFIFSVLFSCKKEGRWGVLFTRAFVIILIVAVLAGWWFLRNYMLYNGDFLGMRASAECAEIHAMEAYKPSVSLSLKERGFSVMDMLFYVPGEWAHNWAITVVCSFIGTFGQMDIFMPYSLTKIYILIFFIGFVALLPQIRKLFFVRGTKMVKSVENKNGQEVVHKKIYMEERWNGMNLLRWFMGFAVIIPCILLIIYSYTSDMQAQGRYIFPMLLPFMYFVTKGFEFLLERFVKISVLKNIIAGLLIAFLVVSCFYTFFFVLLPVYK